MRNFTLGKKGLSMLFFTFILLTGSLPSYGQECPTVTASNQAFCDAQEPEIGDLVASNATGEDISWYDSQTSTTPLPATQILLNGRTYYAGTDGSCANNRAAVNVTIFSSPEILGINATATAQEPVMQSRQSLAVLGICVDDINNPGVTVGDLRTNYDNVAGVQVNWYSSRTSSTPLSSGTALQNNTDYFAGLVVTDPTIAGGSCETNRTRTTVRLYSEAAPTGPAEQEFCAGNNPTLEDIVASGNNRYYTTPTSITELGSTTPLIDGRTYYISTVGEFCESTARLAVTVTVLDEDVEYDPISVELCSENINNPTAAGFDSFYRNLVESGSDIDAGGTFNPTMQELVAAFQSNPYDTFTTTYTVVTECGDENVMVSVTVIESEDANAGQIEDISVPCDDNEIIVLDDSILSEDATTGGTFTAAEGVLDAQGNFNPAIGPGEYVITYTVDDSLQCVTGSDSTTFTITVQDAPYAGEDQDLTFCASEIAAFSSNPQLALNFFSNILENQPGDVDTSGDFDASLNDVLAYYNAGNFSQPFTTFYRVGEGECADEAFISITIIEDEQANAGTIDDITVACASTEVVVLDDSILSDDATRGGTFTADEGVLDANGNFDPSIGAGVYEITYTVSESECVTGTDSTSFNITVQDGDLTVEDIYNVLCSDRINNPTPNGFRNYFLNLITANTDLPRDGSFDPNMNALVQQYNANPIGIFTTNYTVNTACGPVTIEVTVEVIETQEANAGTIEDIPVACNAGQIIVLDDSLLSEDATRGGSFTAEQGVLNAEGNFDPAVGPGEYVITYTVDQSIPCVTGSDSTSFTITVQDDAVYAGEDQNLTFCISEIAALAANPQEALNFLTNILENQPGDVDTTGEFDADLNDLIAYYSAGNFAEPFTTFYRVGEGECTDEAFISITIIEDQEANAGTIEDITVPCASTEVIVLDNSILSENATPGGTFTAAEGVLDANGNFNPSIGAGVYEITYTVSESECVTGTDSTTFNITVQGGDVAAQDIYNVLCSDRINNPTPNGFRNYFLNLVTANTNLPRNGSFDPNMNALVQQYNANPLGIFTTNYTVNTACGPVTIEVTVEVIETQEANAGTIANVPVACDAGQIIVLDDSLLSEDATRGGTFTAAQGVLNADGNFDPAVGPGEYVITYMVNNSIPCVTGQDSTTFTITVVEGNVDANDIAVVLCSDAINNPTPEGFTTYYLNLINSQTNLPANGMFDPTMEELIANYNANPFGIFATNYTVDTECGMITIEVAVEVIEAQDANAGMIANIDNVCPTGDVIVLDMSLLSENATPGGMFTANQGILNEDGNFDPSIGAGEYTITYTVDESMSCIQGSDSTTFTITVVEGANAGPDVTLEYCITDVENMTPEEALAIFNNLIGDDVDQDGTFSPNLNTLLAQFTANPIGTFTTTYTVTEGGCVDTAVLTVIISETVPADAGEINDLEVCLSDAPLNLFTEVGVNTGTFSTEDGVIENGMLNVSAMGTWTITYTVSEENGDCVIGEDSTTFMVTVVEGVDAGEDQFVAICDTQIPPAEGVRDLYLGLLDAGVSRDGTFSPTIEDLIIRYNTVSRYGDFTTTYTVSQGGCVDTAELTVRVLRPIGAGQDRNITFCSTEGPVNLYDYLGTNATQAGTFEGYEDGMFNPSTTAPGVITINYMVEIDDTTCSTNTSAVWTINVTDPEAADAGMDVAVTYCVDQNENIALTNLLDEGVNTTGSFSAPYQNGMFNPSVAGQGEYVITYTLDEADACVIGTDTATITITVAGTTAEAPVADAEQIFCLADNATVADLEATGTNVVWYTNAELTNLASPGTQLVDGAVYYAVSEAGETACEISDPVMVTVTLVDSLSPTIQPLGNEFCRADNPTVQDLIANLDGDGIQIYTSATGGSPLAATTALQNNVTYYATATDPAVNCESSERLPVNVTVGFCGIPEGFSPNGDNINDTFEIPNIRRDYPNFTIEIFNRWGNVVFRGNASVPDWDGVSNQSSTLGDKVLPAGVYFYILNYNDGQTEPFQGKVYLSR